MDEESKAVKEEKNDSVLENNKIRQEDEGRPGLSSADLRNAAYFVLFIAAVFVINAMETGSYRTPWPVAIIASLAGIVLFGYSCVKQNKDDS